MKKIITHKEFIKQIETAISKNKKTSINCGGNLFNEVSSKGLCTFYVRIRTSSLDTKKLLGRFPDLSLKEARDKANIELTRAKDENERQLQKSSKPTFGSYSSMWLSFFKVDPNSNDNSHKNNKRHDNLRASLKILKGLDSTPLDFINPKLVDSVLSKTDKTTGAKRIAIKALNQCLRSAVVDGIIDKNPCENMLNSQGLIAQRYRKPKVKGYAWVEAELLNDKFFSKLTNEPYIHKVFYTFVAMTSLRVGSASELRWSWIDFDNKVIHIPAEYMKMNREFDVPLSDFVASLLKRWEIQCIRDENISPFVFYAKSSLQKPIRLIQVQDPVTNNTQKEVTLHGLRKTARTWMAKIGVPEMIAEYALSHEAKSSLVAVYNKYDYFKERITVMRLWNYFIYTQLPDEFKNLIDPPAQDFLNKCKSDLEDQLSKVALFKSEH